MVRLEYSLTGQTDRPTSETLKLAEEIALRYDYFLGDVIFIAQGIDLSARWGWIPVLDFALGLEYVVDHLRGEGAAGPHLFEFTESDATISFERDHDLVNIAASYSSQSAQVAYSDLRNASTSFLTQMIDDLVEGYPGLSENPLIAAALAGRK